MAIRKERLDVFRKYLDEAERPLFFFDDDPDGLCSFLLLYRYKKTGNGVIIKSTPELNESFKRKVDEYNPDYVFVLDKPMISQEFIDSVDVPIIWLDHHAPVKREGVEYFNPRLDDDGDGRPTSYWAYKIVQRDNWLGVAGCVGDFHVPDFASEFEYTDLLPRVYNTPEKILFDTKLGDFIRLLSFIMKGKASDAMKNIKVLSRIDDPEEIMFKRSKQGNFLYKNYSKLKELYDTMLKEALSKYDESDSLLVYTYKDDRMSFTSDLSNEVLFWHPEKIVIVGRLKGGEYKCSVRSAQNPIEPILQIALEGIDGLAGGHPMACGACISQDSFQEFLRRLRSQLKN